MAFPSWSLGTRRMLTVDSATLHSGTGFQPVALHRPEAGATDQEAPPGPPPWGAWLNPPVAFFQLGKSRIFVV